MDIYTPVIVPMVGAPADWRMPDAASERNVKSVLAMLCGVVVWVVREQNRDSFDSHATSLYTGHPCHPWTALAVNFNFEFCHKSLSNAVGCWFIYSVPSACYDQEIRINSGYF